MDFILDPRFPSHLCTSGYQITMNFVQSLFETYAQAGLSKESDREVSISGLLKRMEEAMETTCKHGTFDCFLSRLLLWRVPHKAEENTESSGNVKHQLPSWSWMTQNQIEFFPKVPIKVPRGTIRFGSGQELYTPIRRLQSCKVQRKGNEILLVDDDKGVGDLRFDTQVSTQARDCVVVGIRDDAESKDAEKTLFVLLVSSTQDNQYQRVGAGMIKAHSISSHYREGMLV